MKAKKLLTIGLALLLSLTALTGCAEDPEEVIIRVGETTIPRWEVEGYLQRQIVLQSQYNDIDLNDPANKEQYETFLNFRLDELIGEAAMREEARVLGLAELTAEEEAQIDQNYLDYYNQTLNNYMIQFGTDENGRKLAEQAYEDLLKSSSLTPERARAGMRNAFILNKLILHVTEGYEPADADVRAYYDGMVQNYQEECIKDPSWFGENFIEPIVYAPEGYRDTARIALHFTTDQRARLSQAATSANNAQVAYQQAVQVYGEGSSESQKLIPDMNKTEEEFAAVYEECYKELEASIETIRQEVLSGADFIDTMERVSEDTNLISYFVIESSTHVESDYLKAALALENVGDISAPVRIEQGVCIIRLMEFVESGVRPFETVEEDLRSLMATNNRIDIGVNLQQEYAEKAKADGIVETFENKL